MGKEIIAKKLYILVWDYKHVGKHWRIIGYWGKERKDKTKKRVKRPSLIYVMFKCYRKKKQGRVNILEAEGLAIYNECVCKDIKCKDLK